MIKPLGYDWKVGIGLVASFAAREVFVGTLATIYSVGSASEGENIDTIKTKMAKRNLCRWHKSIHTCFGNFVALILCLCHAMHEYLSNCKTRNKELEMAYSAAHRDDGYCIYLCVNCLSIFKIISNERFFSNPCNSFSFGIGATICVQKTALEIYKKER